VNGGVLAFGPRTVEIGSGPFWSMVAVVGLGLASLLFLLLAVVLIGYSVVKPGGDGRGVWVGGVVALLGVAWFAFMIAERFTCVARVEVDGAGTWRLLSPVGREVATLPASTPRTLALWTRSSRGAGSTTRTRAALYGFVAAGGRRYDLEDANHCWDLLRQLGYGSTLVYSPDAPPQLRAQAEQGGWQVLHVGRDEASALRLPEHRFDPQGIGEVAAWLARLG
jgi:hypothetical protein